MNSFKQGEKGEKGDRGEEGIGRSGPAGPQGIPVSGIILKYYIFNVNIGYSV